MPVAICCVLAPMAAPGMAGPTLPTLASSWRPETRSSWLSQNSALSSAAMANWMYPGGGREFPSEMETGSVAGTLVCGQAGRVCMAKPSDAGGYS